MDNIDNKINKLKIFRKYIKIVLQKNDIEAINKLSECARKFFEKNVMKTPNNSPKICDKFVDNFLNNNLEFNYYYLKNYDRKQIDDYCLK
jgi:hypothetical protein